MPEPSNRDSPSSATQACRRSPSSSWPLNILLFSILVPVAAAVLLYQLDPFDPVPFPHELMSERVAAPLRRNAQMLKESEFIGVGALDAPKDVAYDSKSGLTYTGCADGWIKRVTLNESVADSVVENWVNTGGRPLGLAHGHDGELLVADAKKVRVYGHRQRRRCRKFHLQGEKKGSIENFIDNLPGAPDNIRYDRQGHYWIGLAAGITTASNLAIRYPFIRKGMAILEKYVASSSQMEKNTGVVAMNLEGELTAHYTDPDLSGITSGIKIGNYLYCGSFRSSYIMRLDLEQHPAVTTT
ncbi:hypothetical protein ACLB2K_003262 [Fragaria x ananassa]